MRITVLYVVVVPAAERPMRLAIAKDRRVRFV